MILEVDVERLRLAHKAVRAELLAERGADGCWLGQMSSSPLATAAAISALVVAHAADSGDAFRRGAAEDDRESVGELLLQGELSELLVNSLHWLARCQNADGGWGDCLGAQSNLAATLLVQAAFRLTGVPAKYADLIVRAEHYLEAQGGADTLRRWDGKEKALAAPILANCAQAGMVPWRQVSALPFEWACVPKRWQSWLHLPINPQALPALVAVGLTKFQHDPPRNPLLRVVRRGLRLKSMAILENLQAVDGSFFDATPLTALVVMSLASAGLQDSPIVERGVEFLLATVRRDASWPVYSNFAIRNTAQAIRSLTADEKSLPVVTPHHAAWEETAQNSDATTLLANDRSTQSDDHPRHDDNFDTAIDWLLNAQHRQTNLSAPVPSGVWGWSDAPGAVANVDDTAAVLLALVQTPQREDIDRAARAGVDWLLASQDDGGGWPTYGSGPSFVSADRIGADSTAHALQALAAWKRCRQETAPHRASAKIHSSLDQQIVAAIDRGLVFLATQQRDDGSFLPLGFGNEHQADEANPVVGTAQVLAMCAELGELDSPLARRAGNRLLAAQHSGGSWGPPRVPLDYSGTYPTGTRTWRENDALAQCSTVEETAQAVTALLPLSSANSAYASAVGKGLTWLANAVEQDRHRRPAVLGWCFTRLWYHERLHPLIFAADALSRATGLLSPERPAAAAVGELASGV